VRARKLLDNAALGPDQLASLYKAFDEGWEIVRPAYDPNYPVSTEVGRLRLANAVLSAHRNGFTDAEEIKATALRLMGVWK
jgi:hypothetical protein